MSEYIPTTGQIRDNYVEGMNAFYGERGASEYADQFSRWLAAHDAEVRAGAVAEESEWEYGSVAIEDDGDGPRALSEDRDYWPAGVTAHASEPDERKARQIIEAWSNASLVRRRKAGPWEPVE